MNSYSTYPFGDFHWKSPVSTASALPASGNQIGDARIAEDTETIYIWSGSAWIPASGGGGGSGTVTSVGISSSDGSIAISGSPVTTSGVIDLSISDSEPDTRYIDFLNGDDSTGNGSSIRPWKTLQHAYDNVTPSINNPFTFILSGGNNDSDVNPITGKPNVSIFSRYQIQIAPTLNISGGSSNDNIQFQNITFVGGLNWIRNDSSQMQVTLDSALFFTGPVLKQTGSGGLFVSAYNCEFYNSEFQASSGIDFFSCVFFGTCTLDDTIPSYFQFLGCYMGAALSLSGGSTNYFAGCEADTPGGYTLTCVTTGNGTPIIQTDSGGVPLIITGGHTLVLTSNAPYDAYTPSDPSKWSGNPTTVQQALDRLAAVVGNLTPIP